MKTILFKVGAKYIAFLLGILITFYVLPIQAQTTVRDHRTKTSKSSKVKVKEEVTSTVEVNAPIDKGKAQILYFDEADALFGKRTALMERSASFKYIGTMDTIHIKQKLHEGHNAVYKMKSGNILFASVKNGKIIELILKDPNSKEIQIQNPQGNLDVDYKEKQVAECLNCKEICVDEIDETGFPTGGKLCYTTCHKVECGSEDHNAILVPKKNKKE